jgi:hypothetical protein
MYNNSDKNLFLKTVENDELYTKFFQKTEDVEKLLGKDLYNFEMKEVMNLGAKQDELELISEYTDWSICQGLKESNINPVIFLLDDEE